MTPRRLAQLLAALVATLVVVAAARAPMPLHDDARGMLRLSWGARPERVEVCRTLTDTELAERPAHMRQRLECIGGSASYRLRATLDGRSLVDELALGGGLRHDRRLYVFHEFAVMPGEHALEVEFVRINSLGTAGTTTPDTGVAGAGADASERDRREAVSRARLRADAVPPRLALSRTVVVAPREVVLVTYDTDRRDLVLGTAKRRP